MTLLPQADLDFLARVGIGPEEVTRQLDLLAHSPAPAAVRRAARIGDGIRRLPPDDHLALLEAHDHAQRSGRWSRFVPASGAATRMFRGLTAFAQRGQNTTRAELEQRSRDGDRVAGDVLRLIGALPRFPFAKDLDALLSKRGERVSSLLLGERVLELVCAVVDCEPNGLGLATAPKALVPFHRRASSGEAITALEEQLAEARATGRDDHGLIRCHFTVSPAHQHNFERTAREISARLAAPRERFELGFSSQNPATDTLALDVETGALARDCDGRLLLRPGGHGALLGNLAATAGDLVVIKNIDNVVPFERRELVVRWRKLLGGVLVLLEQELSTRRRRLREGLADAAEIDAGFELLARELSTTVARTGDLANDRALLLDRLDRPLRVCGVVENRGEPGGGPFWVADANGAESLQIVERAQIDESNPEAAAALASATHFNPVDLSCALRDEAGKPYPLHRWVDPKAAFVTTKSEGGRELRVLERPGLWNGAMAGWNTVFVEVPAATFAPVKTVFDLLRAEHQSE